MVSSCPSVVFEGYMIVISNRAQFCKPQPLIVHQNQDKIRGHHSASPHVSSESGGAFDRRADALSCCRSQTLAVFLLGRAL